MFITKQSKEIEISSYHSIDSAKKNRAVTMEHARQLSQPSKCTGKP